MSFIEITDQKNNNLFNIIKLNSIIIIIHGINITIFFVVIFYLKKKK